MPATTHMPWLGGFQSRWPPEAADYLSAWSTAGSSCGAQEPESADWPEWTSAVHVIQHPDAAGLFRHGQNEFVLGERKSDRRYQPWNHQSGTFKVRNLKRLPNGLSHGRIEVDPPDIEETAAPRNKINRLAIGRPARLIVPMLAVGNSCPRTTRRLGPRYSADSAMSASSPPPQRQSIGCQERSVAGRVRTPDRAK